MESQGKLSIFVIENFNGHPNYIVVSTAVLVGVMRYKLTTNVFAEMTVAMMVISVIATVIFLVNEK